MSGASGGEVRPSSAARDVLVALAQGVAARRLYGAAHPRARESLVLVVEAVGELVAGGGATRFTFLGSEIIHGATPLRGAVPTEWTARLSEAGIQRLEFLAVPTPDEVALFLERLDEALRGAARGGGRGGRRQGDAEGGTRRGGEEGTETETLSGAASGVTSGATPGAEDRTSAIPSIAWGPVRPRDEVETRKRADARQGATTEVTGTLSLVEEMEALAWIWERIRRGGAFPLAEAEGVVRSLGVLLRALPPGSVPRVREALGLDYAHTHALHTAALSLAWARDLALPPTEAMGLGLAGLFHDVGFLLADPDGSLLGIPGPLEEGGREAVERHPVLGGKLLMEAGAPLALAATVAFEHHLGPGGEGYPALGGGRSPHPAATLVQSLSTWDALRSTRPHRPAMGREEALQWFAEEAEGGRIPVEFLARFTRISGEVDAEGVREVEAVGVREG